MSGGDFTGLVNEPWVRSEETRTAYEDLYFVEIVWANGLPTRHLISDQQLGEKWSTWSARFTKTITARPSWVSLGDITFYSQNVRSIELIETITHEEG